MNWAIIVSSPLGLPVSHLVVDAALSGQTLPEYFPNSLYLASTHSYRRRFHQEDPLSKESHTDALKYLRDDALHGVTTHAHS